LASFHCAEREAAFDDIGHDSGIGLHFAIHHKIAAGFGQFDRLADFVGERVRGRAEVREGQEGHARFQFQFLGKFSRQAGDFAQILGAGVDVDGRIGEQEGAVADDHDVHPGGPVVPCAVLWICSAGRMTSGYS
jgi:hypothetical protein